MRATNWKLQHNGKHIGDHAFPIKWLHLFKSWGKLTAYISITADKHNDGSTYQIEVREITIEELERLRDMIDKAILEIKKASDPNIGSMEIFNED